MRTLDGRTIAAAGPRALAWGTAKRLRSHSPSSICYWVTAPQWAVAAPTCHGLWPLREASVG